MNRLLILLLIFFCSCSGKETKKQNTNAENVYVVNNGGCENKETLAIDTLGNNLVKDKKEIFILRLSHIRNRVTHTLF